MSGSSRSEKKRRQDDRQRRLAAAGIQVPQKVTATNRTPLIVIAVVLAVVVIVGAVVLYQRSKTTSVDPTYTATAAGAVVTAGSGPTVVDVYEDYLCPLCDRFEQTYGNEVTTALNAKQITVRFHTIAILDKSTTPNGYSTRAADAALCAVPAGIYPKYHKKLFESQPAEGSAGLTDDQLIAFGTELGATGDFAGCVRGTTHDAAITAETNTSAGTPALQTNGQFGTPTVAVKGAKINIGDADWLKNAIAGK
ncbi:DsbA family protein [Pseudonocardia sp. GCM10023141]|uniref:DsbA family protein n=1 Tax=Pseudonocardia sp. GCM10023141 TaxID=3252653 RepID=UPI003621E209